jgi:hypothetical protein
LGLFCCGDLAAISFALRIPPQNPAGHHEVSTLRDSILLEQREVQGLFQDPKNLKNYIPVNENDEATWVYCWSLNCKQMYEEILNDLARMGFGACPNYSFIINLILVPRFPDRCELIPWLSTHRVVQSEGLPPSFSPEDVQVPKCAIKCYGPGVRFVDDYDGDSQSIGPRCRSLPWGLIKPLNPLKTGDDFDTAKGIPIALDVRNLQSNSSVKCFAIMCVYIADGTHKAVVNLCFASSPDDSADLHMMLSWYSYAASILDPSLW